MAVRDIVVYPESTAVLRAKSEPVRGSWRRVERLIRDLAETLDNNAAGVGLAAPQIGVSSRAVVVRLGSRGDEGEPGPPIPLINPEIVAAGDECQDFDGCLSLPGLYGVTLRPHVLRVKWQDAKGARHNRVFEGFDAVVVHHEIDHLHGVLFIDRVEGPQDLYRVIETEDGRRERVPFARPEASQSVADPDSLRFGSQL